ncbi:g8932 [Coccomyxa elongata]
MKATSGNALSRARSRQTMKERHSSPRPHANTFEQPIRRISFEQGALSISRESSCSNVRFLPTGTSSVVSSDVATPHMSGPLTFAAAMSQRPPMLGTLGGSSRGSSFSSITISAQASQPGVAQPLLQHMSRAHSSPSPLIAGNRADSKSQAVNTPRRRTLQGPHNSGNLDCSGFHNSQALTPIRSGQVESFQRPVQPWQPFRSAFGDASLHNTGDMFSWPSESERSTASALLTSPVPDKIVSPAETVGPKRSLSGGPLNKLRRMCSTSFLGNMVGRVGPSPQRRPRRLSDAQAKQERASLTFGLAQDLQPGVSAPAIMQHAGCHDAAIATLGIRQAPVQATVNQLQVIRTRSTSLDSMAGSRSFGKALQPDKYVSHAHRQRALGAKPPTKACLTPELRALKLQELLIVALKEWTKAYGPLVLLLEDFDRADALSWSLLSRCAEEIDMAVLVIVAVRPNDGAFATPLPGQEAKKALHAKMCALLDDIRENPFTLRLVLQPFTPEHTQAFLNAALDGVLMVVFMQQHQQLRDGAVEQADLSAFIRNTVTIHSLITNRIDGLQPSQQLTLKVASVMGMSVSLDLLVDMYPIPTTREALERDLIDLEAARFLKATEVPGTWMITQVLARDVAYELIPFSQRRLLHAELARALEEDGRAGAVPAAILAYHWTHSCAGIEASEWRRALMAVTWWERAAHDAQDKGIDPSEALRLFQRADAIAAILKASYRASWAGWSAMVVHPVRRAHWQRCMAACGLALMDLDGARRHALQALHHLGAPLPSQPAGGISSLLSWLTQGPLGCVSGAATRRISADGSDEVDISLVGDFAPWDAEAIIDAGEDLNAMNGGLGKTEEHWQEKRMQEAAAVLGLLVDASLMLTPVDVDALKYIHTTAAAMQGKRIWGRVPKTSALFPVVEKCKAALMGS